MRENIVLVGSGGHCRAVIDVLEQQNHYKIFGVVDEDSSKQVLDYPVIGADKDLPDIYKSCQNAVINGAVVLEDNNFYGSNATSRQGITIDNFTKAGAVVKQSVV